MSFKKEHSFRHVEHHFRHMEHNFRQSNNFFKKITAPVLLFIVGTSVKTKDKNGINQQVCSQI